MPSSTRREEHDVVVVGGGPAGVCAAIASSRGGADTVLIEQLGSLGGMASAAMFQPWRGFHSFGKQLVAGIAEEIVKHLQSAGGSPGHLLDPTGVGFTVTPFDHEMLPSVLRKLVEAEHVKLILDAQFVDTQKTGGIVDSIRIHRREGDISLSANVFIDATGNGAVAVNAGTRHVKHDAGASYRFSMDHVDEKALLEYAQKNPHEFSGPASIKGTDFLSLKGFTALTRDWRNAAPELKPSDSIQIDGTVRKGEVVVSMIGLPNVDMADPESLVRADMRCRQLAPKAAAFLVDHCPGLAGAKIHAEALQAGFHASRQICSRMMISDSDVMSGRIFDDAIATCAMPGRPTSTFQVPREALLVPGIENLLVAGRAILPPTALFATNSQPASMQLGEAAGEIACELAGKLTNKKLRRDGERN